MTTLNLNLTRLVGTLDIQGLEQLRREAREMKQLGYHGVYFNHIFFTIEQTDFRCAPEDILFREDNALIVRRPEAQLRQIRQIIEDEGLVVPSSHFLNMLPEPGAAVESIFATHETILDMAQVMGMERVTTHIGGIARPTAARAATRPTAAERMESGEISPAEYAEQVKHSYGPEKILSDSLVVYRHLCREAARRGIAITLETACNEMYEINTRPQAILDFITEVGADNFGICVDSGHCHLKNLDVAEVIRGCATLFLETHFHDNFGINDNHNPVGIGTINWFDIISTMNEVGYEGDITFEQTDYVTNHRNWMLFVERIEKGAV